MIDQLTKTINLLKDRVVNNIQQIKENEKKINNLLKHPGQEKRTEFLQAYLKRNKELLNENNESLKIQFSLINYMNKFRDEIREHDEKPQEAFFDIDKDYFELTIKGIIKYDKSHPKFHDDSFFEKLMNYYREKENYEMCGHLLELKNH